MYIKPVNFTENMPRTDYPRPQWVRNNWYCLNGEWEFAFDFGKSGEARGMVQNGEYSLSIIVPFCPESKLSGIEYKDFIPAVWYRRTLTLDTLPDGRGILHFGAVDYLCKVWVNGIFCGMHKGGYTSFSFDITDALKEGNNTIVVYAEDDILSNKQPSGKQCLQYHSSGCRYTRTTGIYQTVWIEFVSSRYLETMKITPHAKNGAIEADIILKNALPTDRVRLCAYYDKREVGSTTVAVCGQHAVARLQPDEIHLWNVGEPKLYDLTVQLIAADGNAEDTVESYFALRDVEWSDNALFINGKPIFMRTILDQGFHPDGVYTAPDDNALKRDITLAIELGFNGARLHKRLFEDRTLYWADKLGYLVWGEHAGISDWRLMGGIEHLAIYLPEWIEAVNQYYNHPSVIGWICLNETYHSWDLDMRETTLLYRITKQIDPYRPVIDASGGIHRETDMFDVHEYEQDPQKLADYLRPMVQDLSRVHTASARYRGAAPMREETYSGQPYWISECGGTFWNPKDKEQGWGYGNSPSTEEEFIQRYEGLIKVMCEHTRVCGFCWTQLTDIEQEQNGLFYYDRTPKFSKESYERIRNANQQVAYIEKQTTK